MTLDTGLRLVFMAAMLVVVAVGVLVLQTRHSGQIRATKGQKTLAIAASIVGVVVTVVTLYV